MKDALRLNHGIRDLFEGSTLGISELSELKNSAPPTLEWRVYDHCAGITRLYALFERFINDLAVQRLEQLPNLYQTYTDLPESIRSAYRVGISTLIPRAGKNRYAHLTELELAKSLYFCASGTQPFTLTKDAFFIEDQNFRSEAVIALFNKLGIDNAWSWVEQFSSVKNFITEIRGSATTAEAELRSFVNYRNIAAHGIVEDIVAYDEVLRISDFICAVCEALLQLVSFASLTQLVQTGKALHIGILSERFKDRRFIFKGKGKNCSLKEGGTLTLKRSSACFDVKIESIMLNYVQTAEVNALEGQEIGLRLSQDAAKKSDVYQILA